MQRACGTDLPLFRCTQDEVVLCHHVPEVSWLRCIEAFDVTNWRQMRLVLFPADCPIPVHAVEYRVQVKLGEFTLHHPQQCAPITTKNILLPPSYGFKTNLMPKSQIIVMGIAWEGGD